MSLLSTTMYLAILNISYFQKSYIIFSFFVYVCPYENLWAPHEFRHSQRPESTSDPLGLELQESVSHLPWELGTTEGPGSPAGVVSDLNH